MFKDKTLRYVFYLTLALTLLLPLLNIYLIYPSFRKLIIEDRERNAVQIANHLRNMYIPAGMPLSGPLDLGSGGGLVREEFGLEKVKVFSESGRVVYSTDPENIGELNDKSYFHDIVAKGMNFTKVVKKDSRSMEGRLVRTDVVEAYVPIMEAGRFIGAFEIYFDISESKKKLDRAVIVFSLVPTATLLCYLSLIGVGLSRMDAAITRKQREEGMMLKQQEDLERAIKERTGELEEANRVLHQEVAERRQAEAERERYTKKLEEHSSELMAAKTELQRSESFLNTIFDSIHDPFCIFDREFKIVKVNNEYAKIKNHPMSSLRGKRCYEVFESGAGPCKNCVVERTMLSKDPCAKEKKLTLPTGADAWLEIFTYPICSDLGEVTHVIEYIRDITDRKKTDQERTRLIEELEILSTTDSLTGMFNRRALLGRLENEFDRAKRYDSALSIILCDIDHFKTVNDTHGHATGDRALQSVADILRNHLRRPDSAGRYGGDEFMIVLPETEMEGSAAFAERLRDTVGSVGIKTDADSSVSVTLSLGVAEFKRQSQDIYAFIKAADDALYASKQFGRNRVTCAK